MKQDEILHKLIHMSRTLGDPAYDYAILGEGNTSARADDTSFWVKASGAELRTIDQSGFVQVDFGRVLDMLEQDTLSDQEIKAGLTAAQVDPTVGVRPSVETVLHALALGLEGIDFIGHTHPTAINALLCSQQAKEAVAGRLFPDEIVYCGVAPVFVPYTDPGLPLAHKVRDLINQYLATYGQVPRVILMQNHGLIALGNTPQQVENITAMAVKAARVLLGTYAMGGPHFLSEQNVARIHTRPDEEYRRRFWKH